MTTPRPGRVLQRRIAETVATELRIRILDSTDDYRLPTQDQLVQDFGVSYPSIREALRILETEGLVTVRRGNVGGAEVHRPDESSAAYHLGLALQGARTTLGDLATGLQILEPMCAAECARRADRAETLVPALRANVEASHALVADNLAFRRISGEFHDLIIASTPNVTVRFMVNSLVALFAAQQQAWSEVLSKGDRHPSLGEAEEGAHFHEVVTDAIAAGDPDEAARLYRTHLVATHALLPERFADGTVNAASAAARHAIQSSHRSRL